MSVAMTFAALIAFGQIALALVLLYLCGILIVVVRRSQPRTVALRREQFTARRDVQ